MNDFTPQFEGSNRPPQTNGKSIAAMVLGILAIIIPYIGLILGIIAIVFAKISLNEIKKRGDNGRGFAITGLVCGIVGTVLYAVIITLAVIVLSMWTTTGGGY
jgi:uncharacterized Tic20 family protein